GGDRRIVQGDRVAREYRVRRQDELVLRRASHGVPCEGGRSRKARRAAREARQEGMERSRRRDLGPLHFRRSAHCRVRSTREREHGESKGNSPNERHTSEVFGSCVNPAVPRTTDATEGADLAAPQRGGPARSVPPPPPP